MSLALETDAQSRAYVEAELDRTVRAKSPELEAQFRDAYPMAGSSPYLWWRVVDVHAESQPFYTIEARRVEREFLIWFGNITCGVWAKRLVMRQAVHRAVETVQRDSHGARPATERAAPFPGVTWRSGFPVLGKDCGKVPRQTDAKERRSSRA